MLDSPIITFIVPAYNSSSYIERCIDSILSSGFERLEIIAIDDGSTDDTFYKLKCFSSLDNRIQVVSKGNEGQGVARNLGIEMAKGEYIAFVDSDDYLSNSYFNKLVPLLVDYTKKFDFINFRLDFRTENGRVGYILPKFNRDVLTGSEIFIKSMLDEMVYSSPCNKLYKKSFLKENNIKFPATRKNEDILFSRVMSYFATQCLFINDVLYHAEIRSGSTSRAMSVSSISDTIKIFDFLECFLIKHNDFEDNKLYFNASVKKVFTQLLFLCSVRIQADSEYRMAIDIFKKSNVYSIFKSMCGLQMLKIKSFLAYFLIRAGGLFLIRNFAKKIIAKITY